MANRSAPTQLDIVYYEAEVPEGLEVIAATEIEQKLNRAGLSAAAKGAVRFVYPSPPGPATLAQLHTVTAVYAVLHFPVPRPKSLLGHEHFHKLLAHIRAVREASPDQPFETFYISAAGSGSSVMERLKNELTAHTGLAAAASQGDLLLRIRRSQGADGWEVMIRLTSRPLATRHWRVANMEGALNAAVARAMILMTNPAAEDTFLNLVCGSGTLCIERALHGKAQTVTGCDISPQALEWAITNIAAAGTDAAVKLVQADVQALPFPSGCFNVLCADLPFGQLVGSHAENRKLYPRILTEAARVAAPGARFALITHEIKLMDELLRQQQRWNRQQVIQVTLGGLHPRIFILKKSD